MTQNRDRLYRTPDGRYLAGVAITQDALGRFVAEVFVARKGIKHGEIISLPALRLPPEATFENAARKAREWALTRLPRIFGFTSQDLAVELLGDDREFTPPRRTPCPPPRL